MSNIILETPGLTRHYGGVHALDDANFILHAGERVAVVDDNGAGKSTFVRQITAVEQRTAGKVCFDEQDVAFAGPLQAREAGIEMVFQTLALANDPDVPSNLFLGRKLCKFRLGPFSVLDRKTMRARTLEALKTTAVKMPNFDSPTRNMSGGRRQCMSIARTAALASRLVFMDEPTAALGVQETAQVENIIRGLKERGVPLILVSHNLRQAFDLVDRIVVFCRGRIVASLRKDETDGNDIVSYITGVKGNGADVAFA
jgi:fructose transport system ATP-binding protein